MSETPDRRALLRYLDSLVERMRALPANSPARKPLIAEILRIEDILDASIPLTGEP